MLVEHCKKKIIDEPSSLYLQSFNIVRTILLKSVISAPEWKNPDFWMISECRLARAYLHQHLPLPVLHELYRSLMMVVVECWGSPGRLKSKQMAKELSGIEDRRLFALWWMFYKESGSDNAHLELPIVDLKGKFCQEMVVFLAKSDDVRLSNVTIWYNWIAKKYYKQAIVNVAKSAKNMTLVGFADVQLIQFLTESKLKLESLALHWSLGFKKFLNYNDFIQSQESLILLDLSDMEPFVPSDVEKLLDVVLSLPKLSTLKSKGFFFRNLPDKRSKSLKSLTITDTSASIEQLVKLKTVVPHVQTLQLMELYINEENVKDLVPVWKTELRSLRASVTKAIFLPHVLELATNANVLHICLLDQYHTPYPTEITFPNLELLDCSGCCHIPLIVSIMVRSRKLKFCHVYTNDDFPNYEVAPVCEDLGQKNVLSLLEEMNICSLGSSRWSWDEKIIKMLCQLPKINSLTTQDLVRRRNNEQ